MRILPRNTNSTCHNSLCFLLFIEFGFSLPLFVLPGLLSTVLLLIGRQHELKHSLIFPQNRHVTPIVTIIKDDKNNKIVSILFKPMIKVTTNKITPSNNKIIPAINFSLSLFVFCLLNDFIKSLANFLDHYSLKH